MSSLKDKAKMFKDSLTSIASNVINGEEVTITEQEFRARMVECQKCEQYFKPLNQCKECGCFLSIKGRLADQVCPLSKWKK